MCHLHPLVPLLPEGPLSSAFSLSSLFPLPLAIGFLSSTFMPVSGFFSLFLSNWDILAGCQSLCFSLLISVCFTFSLPAHCPSHPSPPPTPLPAACSPWAFWPCSGGSASSFLAWLGGLCCCIASSSKAGVAGGQAGAGGKSPGMGRSGFTRSGKCGLTLGGSQFPLVMLDSSPCRREAVNQPMM